MIPATKEQEGSYVMDTEKIGITRKNRGMAGFTGCPDEYLVIPPEMLVDGEIRRVDVIDDEAFWQCDGLRTVVIPGGPKLVGCSAFRDCGNLREVCLGDDIVAVGDSAFLCCYHLERVTLPAGRRRYLQTLSRGVERSGRSNCRQVFA